MNLYLTIRRDGHPIALVANYSGMLLLSVTRLSDGAKFDATATELRYIDAIRIASERKAA